MNDYGNKKIGVRGAQLRRDKRCMACLGQVRKEIAQRNEELVRRQLRVCNVILT